MKYAHFHESKMNGTINPLPTFFFAFNLYSNISDRYDKARSNADLARYTSDLNSETENLPELPKKR